jgi:predicted TIM-barrel fold metal-dependent hydrolase
MTTLASPPPTLRRPNFKVPANTCDAHCHVFGPGAIFPYTPNRRDTPDVDFQKLHDGASALVKAGGDRVLWGTDFPHPNPSHHADDAAAQRRVLVDNPARLYGFA